MTPVPKNLMSLNETPAGTTACATSVRAAKAIERQRLLAERRALPTEERRLRDQQLRAVLAAFMAQHPVPAGAWLAVFHPLPDEPDLLPLYRLWQAGGIRLALPRVTQRAAPFSFVAWSPDTTLRPDVTGVPAPDGPAILPHTALIPCLGYSTEGFRLGYGGGYYDRTLPLHPALRRVGVCHASARVSIIPEAHDTALDFVLNEQGQIWPPSSPADGE